MEFIGLSICRTRHARQLAVEAKIVLKGNGCQRLVLSLNLHAFFGFYRLVQAIAPAAAGHQATSKFVHYGDLTILVDVLLVTVVQVVGPQRSVQVVHQGDVGRVVQRRALGD